MSNANIHGLGDNNNENDNNNNENNYYYSENDTTPIYEKFTYKGDPKLQTIPSFLKDSVCPFFHFKSFSFIIIVINVVIYIITFLPNGLDKILILKYFLPPSTQTLDLFGDLYARALREHPWQFYRWITNDFLHLSFDHIFSNSFSILILGTMFEYLIGTWKYIVIYFMSGILGSLFSVLVSPKVRSVGASISICGLISGLLAFLMLNWNSLPAIFGIKNRCLIIAFPLIMIIMSIPLVISTVSGSGIDFSDTRINVYGHVGGLIFGFFSSIIFIKPRDENDSCFLPYKVWFYTGIVVCSLFALIGFLCFYLLDSFKQY